jgi:hypothetical protein
VKRDEKAISKKKEPWGPFQYFIFLSSVLIVVMWGVIIFGGPEAVSGQKIDYNKNKRVFLFMVDNSIKRYARYQHNQYPNSLHELVPKYLRLREEDLTQLNRFSYRLDPQKGYELSYAHPGPGEMNIVISPKGITYESTVNVGASG